MTEYKTILYEAINSVNGKRYIGITGRGLHTRSLKHICTARSGFGSAFGAAIRKYGSDNFKFHVLVICPDFEYAKLMEVAAIKMFEPEYNVTSGGDGAVGFRHSEEHKAWMSERHKGKQFFLGGTLTAEHKDRIRQSRLAGKGGPKKGQKYTLSPEERARRGLQMKTNRLMRKYGKQDNSLTEG